MLQLITYMSLAFVKRLSFRDEYPQTEADFFEEQRRLFYVPGSFRDEYPQTEADFFEEQRRLFYVSITRSKKTLVLSRANQILKGEAARLGLAQGHSYKFRQELQMSPYLHDIINYLPKYQNGEDWEGSA